jgi:putative tryptophan/tyrosine transport system substrate-binding protein
MRRRELLGLVGGAAAWPLTVRAQQQPAVPLVGFIDSFAVETGPQLLAAFRKGLSEMGHAEGRNVTIEYHTRQRGRAPEVVADLVRRRVAVIVTSSLNAALSAKTVTTTIPIIFNAGGDPVATGLVASLNRPGGNVTGVSSLGGELGTKRLGLLHALVPGAKRFGLLVDPITAFARSTIDETQQAAATVGLQIDALDASTRQEIDTAFASLVQKGIDALLVGQAASFAINRTRLVALAATHRLPAGYTGREFSEIGGLISYGASWLDQFRQVGIYTGRVLKGEKPADLPVMQPTKFELVINLQTARTLGVEVPPTLLAQADEVIE